MKKFFSALCLMLLLPLLVCAQEDETKKEKEKNGEEQVTVHQDDELHSLIFGEKEKQEADEEGTVRPNRNEQPSGTTRKRRTGVDAATLSQYEESEFDREFSSHQYIDGFRIQVCSRGNTHRDHELVRQTGKKFKGYFRDWRVEVRQKTPRWVCLAGDFATRKEAQAALQRVQRTHKFKSATIVRAKIKNARYRKEPDTEIGVGLDGTADTPTK